MKVSDEVRSSIKESIEKGLKELGYDGALDIQPAPEGKGDAAVPCFRIAKAVKRNPVEVAAALADGFEPNELVASVSAQGPYINFIFDRDGFAKLFLSAIDEGSFFSPERKERVLLEHTSANPTGPLHVGRARNPIIGDTMAGIMRAAGYDVQTEYYVDDMGKQAVMVAWGVDRFGAAKDERADYLYVKHYQKVNELMDSDEKAKESISDWIRRYENGDAEIRENVRKTVDEMMFGILASLKRLGIELDNLAYESDIVFSGKVDEVIEGLEAKGVLKKDESGALYIDLADYGISGKDTRFFIARSDGTSLYSTRDVAYHIDKGNRSDIMLDVLGEDHGLQSKAVSIMLDILGHKKPDVLFYAFVGLPEGRMSTRKGRVVYLDDLMDEAVDRAYEEVKKRRDDLSEEEMRKIAEAVGISAIRYNIIRVQPEKRMVFKWEDALNFEGESAPFIQYSYARASSIIRKAGAFERVFSAKEDGEWALLMKMSEYPSVIEEAAEKKKPHMLASYLRGLASAFNDFYRDYPVLNAEERDSRLTLTDAFRKVIGNGMRTLGITVLERM